MATTYIGEYNRGQGHVSGWQDVVAISAGREHTVGLKTNGTVIAKGSNDKGQCGVSYWQDIIAISAGENQTVGLKADGTVVAVGENDYGQCNVSDWRDIVAISAGPYCTVGLKANGTLVATGTNRDTNCKVSGLQLFECYDNLEQELENARIAANRRLNGLCQHCGGALKGMLFKKCVSCGKAKDY